MTVHNATKKSIPSGIYRSYLRPYWKENNLNFYHNKQLNARREWINNGKSHDPNDEYYIRYKYRKRKRKAEKSWRLQVHDEMKHAAELDIGEFYRCIRKNQKVTTDLKVPYNDKDCHISRRVL